MGGQMLLQEFFNRGVDYQDCSNLTGGRAGGWARGGKV